MYAYFDVCTHVCNGVDDSAKSYICLLDNYAIFPHYNVGYYVNNIYLQIKLKQMFYAIEIQMWNKVSFFINIFQTVLTISSWFIYVLLFFSVFIHLTMNAYSSKIWLLIYFLLC